MKCQHCGIHFHDNWMLGEVARGNNTGWFYRTAVCSECKQITIELCPPLTVEEVEEQMKEVPSREHHVVWRKVIMNNGQWRQVHPIGSNRGPVPAEVPQQIAMDYVEACQVLPLSAKASAALSRRCLQAVLNEKGYKGSDLAKQIDQLLKARVLPTHIHETVDAIRKFGNFGAHPINDITTLQIIDVDTAEAEWCLEILEALFDHFYVGPEAAKKKRAALDAKLTAAGKP